MVVLVVVVVIIGVVLMGVLSCGYWVFGFYIVPLMFRYCSTYVPLWGLNKVDYRA